MDNTLKWFAHIAQLKSKLCSLIYTLNVVIKQVDLDVLKVIYYDSFQFLASYCIIFWSGSSSTEKFVCVQKLCTILLMGYRDSYRGLLRGNNILTIYSLYIYSLLLFPENKTIISRSAKIEIKTDKRILIYIHFIVSLYEKRTWIMRV